MNLYHLQTKSREELKSLCRQHNLRANQNKPVLVQLLIQKKCFQAIRDYEDDVEPFEDTEIEARINPRPDPQEIEDLINGFKEKYHNDAEIDFTTYENPHYNHLYSYHKQTQYDEHGGLGDRGEKILFHGTDENNIQSILENDLSLTINTRHGSAYGKGIYFTDDLELACKYSERGNKEKYFIVSIVHVGNIVQGNLRMDMLPQMPNTDRCYDTSVDNELTPKQFVKYKNHQYNFLGILHVKITNEESSLLRYHRISNVRRAIRTRRGNSNTPSINPQPVNPQPVNPRIRANAKVYLINKTKMPINIYYMLTSAAKEIRSGKRVFLSDELREFFNFNPEEMMSITREDCWERIRIYSLSNKLEINSQKNTFLPNQELITLLEVSPTTRISISNIQQFLKPHYIPLTDDNFGYLIQHAKRIVNVKPGKEHTMNSYLNHEFIGGFFTTEKEFPRNFVNVKEFKVESHDDKVVLEML
tara:strand:+ start:327 stop:1748 length:1422 start_codon:yes stop_codon:yes gene_type:complete